MPLDQGAVRPREAPLRSAEPIDEATASRGLRCPALYLRATALSLVRDDAARNQQVRGSVLFAVHTKRDTRHDNSFRLQKTDARVSSECRAARISCAHSTPDDGRTMDTEPTAIEGLAVVTNSCNPALPEGRAHPREDLIEFDLRRNDYEHRNRFL